MKLGKFNPIFLAHFLMTFDLGVTAGQNPKCGGILDKAEDTLTFIAKDTPRLCIWILNPPNATTTVQFTLEEILESSQLSVYPPEGQFHGIPVRPVALSRAGDTATLKLNWQNNMVLVVWAPPSQKNPEPKTMLKFRWQSSERKMDNAYLAENVAYVEGMEGQFIWKRAGMVAQSLLWVLNTPDSGNSVELRTRANANACSSEDPCRCAYLWVYEVHSNYLRAVSTGCGRASTQAFTHLRPTLLVLGFSNPLYQSGNTILSLSWEGESRASLNPATAGKLPECSSRTGTPKNCAEIGAKGSGRQFNRTQTCAIYPFGAPEKPKVVLCDFDTDGGSWTVIQKRSSGPKDEFSRNWTDYENGFGSPPGNYWLGLEAIHELTKNGDQELRIDLWDFEGGHAYAQYSNFSINNYLDNYRLTIGGYSGNAGDGFTVHHSLNGMPFSTKDRDNSGKARCPERQKGAWWYKNCGFSNLNGLYYEKGEKPDSYDTGIFWYLWKNNYDSMRQVEMKIRPRR